MSERLHYFTEATTPVSFDCSDSDIDSDLDDLSRRPISESDRAKQHARQLQLWSDEARRRRSPALSPTPALTPHRRPSSVSLHDVLPPGLPEVAAPPPSAPKMTTPNELLARVSADRQQSNLSERARVPNSRRVSRSHSAKNLRIRITPSSSSKSLMSDIESELGHSAPVSAPQSPQVAILGVDTKPTINEKTTLPPAQVALTKTYPETEQKPQIPIEKIAPPETLECEEPPLAPTPAKSPDPNKPIAGNKVDHDEDAGNRSRLVRRMSFVVRGKRLSFLRKLWRR